MKLIIRPKVTCGAIIKKGDKILLTKRNIVPYKNYWCLPGGHIKLGEKVEDAIRREVREETGLDFKPKFFNYYDEIIFELRPEWHAVSLFFIGNVRGKLKINRLEVKEFKWFSKKEIKGIKLAFLNREVLKDYFNLKGR